MRVVILGDVVGRPGSDLLCRSLKNIKERYEVEFVVANIENAANGTGITRDIGQEILDAGVDVMTSGNHIYDKKEGVPYIEKETRLLRPANYPSDAPGRGVWLGSSASGTQIAVINLQGRVFMPPNDCPFKTADRLISEIGNRASVIIVDHHAEATSEKVALGRYLDGRASIVIGTHTHVQTADEQILPGGTAYITDVGMTGPHNGVIGVQSDLVLTRFLRGVPVKFETATGDAKMNGVVVEVDERSGKALNIERLSVGESKI